MPIEPKIAPDGPRDASQSTILLGRQKIRTFSKATKDPNFSRQKIRTFSEATKDWNFFPPEKDPNFCRERECQHQTTAIQSYATSNSNPTKVREASRALARGPQKVRNFFRPHLNLFRHGPVNCLCAEKSFRECAAAYPSRRRFVRLLSRESAMQTYESRA